jgi:hypothetical protein
MEYIAFDAHKRYTLASVAQADGRLLREERIEHERGALQAFLAGRERGSPVAVETMGSLVLDRRRDRSRGMPAQARELRFIVPLLVKCLES